MRKYVTCVALFFCQLIIVDIKMFQRNTPFLMFKWLQHIIVDQVTPFGYCILEAFIKEIEKVEGGIVISLAEVATFSWDFHSSDFFGKLISS